MKGTAVMKKYDFLWRRGAAVAIAAVLVLAMVLTGTLALQAANQQPSQQQEQVAEQPILPLNGAPPVPPNPGGRLHDDFEVIAPADWRAGVTANKDVYVENFGDEDIFVRVRLSETMTIDGTSVPAADIRNFWEWEQGGQKYFMPTANTNPNSSATDIKGAATDPNNPANVSAFPPEAGEHDFFEGMTGARLTLDAEIITMAAWHANPVLGPYWVIDTDGWAYWAQALKPGEATGLLLDSITLIQEPRYAWTYDIHISAHMATEDDWYEYWAGRTDEAEELMEIITTNSARPWEDAEPGDTFTDVNGIVWRVLEVDEDGNMLILTERVFGVTGEYGPPNTIQGPPFYNASAMPPIDFMPLAGSNIRTELDKWWDDNISPQMRNAALPFAPLTDVRTGTAPLGANWQQEDEDAGLSAPAARTTTISGPTALFILSISEANRFLDNLSAYDVILTDTAISAVDLSEYQTPRPRGWWLRSPGGYANNILAPMSGVSYTPIMHVGEAVIVSASTSYDQFGLRPAMWIAG